MSYDDDPTRASSRDRFGTGPTAGPTGTGTTGTGPTGPRLAPGDRAPVDRGFAGEPEPTATQARQASFGRPIAMVLGFGLLLGAIYIVAMLVWGGSTLSPSGGRDALPPTATDQSRPSTDTPAAAGRSDTPGTPPAAAPTTPNPTTPNPPTTDPANPAATPAR